MLGFLARYLYFFGGVWYTEKEFGGAKMNHLIVFADYGLDDAAATVTLLEQQERFAQIDLVPIGGNVPVEVAYKNCMTLLSCFPAVLKKIRVVDTRHVAQPAEYLASIHGKDGMGDLLPAAEAPVFTVGYEAWLAKLQGKEQVLSLGPLTLVRPVMERHVHPLVIMGGCVHTHPNFHGFEFNHALDQEAFSVCAPLAVGVVTLDTCRVSALDVRTMTLPEEGLHTAILRRDVELSYARGEDGCYVWDDVAASFLLYPQRFSTHWETDPHGNRYPNAVFRGEGLYFQA